MLLGVPFVALALAACQLTPVNAGKRFFDNHEGFKRDDPRIPHMAKAVRDFEALERRGGIFDDWRPPGPTDSRSPCPAMNSLANHGILPRNGRGISFVKMLSAGYDGLGFSPIAMAYASIIALAGNPIGDLNIDLDKLNHHGILEHDCSLSRVDFAVGNNRIFNATRWKQTLSHVPIGSTHWSGKAAVAAHYEYLQVAKKDDPTFNQGPVQFIFQFYEIAIFQLMLGDYLTGNPRMDWVRVVFEEERLPYKEGWRPHVIPVDFPSILGYTAYLMAMSPDPVEEATDLSISGFINIMSTSELSPRISCLLSLPTGCDGSSSHVDIPGIGGFFGGLLAMPTSAAGTGVDIFTGAWDVAGSVMHGMMNAPQEVIGRLSPSKPWEGPDAAIIKSPPTGGGDSDATQASKDAQAAGLFGLAYVGGGVQSAALGVLNPVLGIPGKAIGSVAGGVDEVLGALVPYLGRQQVDVSVMVQAKHTITWTSKGQGQAGYTRTQTQEGWTSTITRTLAAQQTQGSAGAGAAIGAGGQGGIAVGGQVGISGGAGGGAGAGQAGWSFGVGGQAGWTSTVTQHQQAKPTQAGKPQASAGFSWSF